MTYPARTGSRVLTYLVRVLAGVKEQWFFLNKGQYKVGKSPFEGENTKGTYYFVEDAEGNPYFESIVTSHGTQQLTFMPGDWLVYLFGEEPALYKTPPGLLGNWID